MNNSQGLYLTTPQYAPLLRAYKQAAESKSKLFKQYVLKSLEKLKVCDAISLAFAVGFFVVAIFVAGNERTKIYYPLYSPGVRYWPFAIGSPPGSVMNVIETINQCPGHKFMDDGGPAAEWGGQKFLPFYYPHFSNNLYPWFMVLTVLAVTSVFVFLRWSLNGGPIPLYEPVGPHFFRWLEYLFTSPLMVVVIAIAAGIRDVQTLTVLGGAQAMLIILGFCNEHLIADAWDCLLFKLLSQALMPIEITEAHEISKQGAKTVNGTAQHGPAHKGTQPISRTKPLLADPDGDNCDLPVDSVHKQFLRGSENLEAAFRLIHVMCPSYDELDASSRETQARNLCRFHYMSRLPLILMRLFVSLAVSWVGFICMWVAIVGSFQTLANSFDDCGQYGQDSADLSVPVGVRMIVWGQLACFALFGFVQSWQVIEAYREVHRDMREFDEDTQSESKGFIAQVDDHYRKYYQKSTKNFLDATWYYTILNIVSKSLLALCLIVVSVDMQPSG